MCLCLLLFVLISAIIIAIVITIIVSIVMTILRLLKPALIEFGEKNFDYVLVDTPPTGAAIDAAVGFGTSCPAKRINTPLMFVAYTTLSKDT